ncbi:MAG: Gfo/Idh/MocA family oxidoreductase [Candidatus Marinimicrobia bacterium]|nr:Gfo/Idh/MocA family oxidoreductase [Candidatus Neomarinimicrobiota bacterium]
MKKPKKTAVSAAQRKPRAPRARRRRYAIVGTGGRSQMFSKAILDTYPRETALVALCDPNPLRMAYHNTQFKEKYGAGPVPTYAPADFDRMLREQRPDAIIVTCMDRLHDHYIVRALEAGCDAITEKPMTTTIPKCRAILDAVERTGRNLRVTFNYRYSPARSTIKELLLKKIIGDIKSVHFEWLLDTVHGADYFRRWHRDKRNSGGLMVHKATHHFDLVNWWLDSAPETVFGFGQLAFYGAENAEARGVTQKYFRGTSPEAAGDPFALNLKDGKGLEGLYLKPEKHDHYYRDRNVFSDGISIEDTMNVLVRYRNGVQMTYALTAYSPWEGYRIAFNGTAGRIELDQLEKSYVSAASGAIGKSFSHSQRITVFPHWEKPYTVEPPAAIGGHGGGDAPLLADLFAPGRTPDPLGRAAGHLDGARSILTGIAANESFATGRPVRVDDLLALP